MTAKEILKQWFSNLKKPTQAHFWAWIESYWHKSEKIPMQNIEGLDTALQDTVSDTQFKNHLKDYQAHKELFDNKVDKEQGKGLSANDFTNELKHKLDNLQMPDVSEFLKKGGYIGTAQDLKDLIDNKVDKDGSKGLSTNDFTNAFKQKLEQLQNPNLLDYVKKEVVVSIQQDIENIKTLLRSDDTDLDTIQELANFIKANKKLLFKLQISNIIGLEEALSQKAPIKHDHDERYFQKPEIEELLTQKAPADHSHNWEDIQNKPANLATTENVNQVIQNYIDRNNYYKHKQHNLYNINYNDEGGVNISVKNSDISTEAPGVINRSLHRINGIAKGEGRYRISFWIKSLSGTHTLYTDFCDRGSFSDANTRSWYKFEVDTTFKHIFYEVDIYKVDWYDFLDFQFSQEGDFVVKNIEVTKIPTYVTQLKINGNINTGDNVFGFAQNGRNIITTGTNNIIITIDSLDGFQATYQKAGTGDITFIPAHGLTLTQVDDTNVINGKKGSTATISIVGTEILLRVSNV